jgi:hypothetical protein
MSSQAVRDAPARSKRARSLREGEPSVVVMTWEITTPRSSQVPRRRDWLHRDQTRHRSKQENQCSCAPCPLHWRYQR